MNILAVIRIVLGALFIFSGGEKLLSPPENFMYVVEGYNILPLPAVRVVALTFPWIELITGTLVFSGFFLREALAVLGCISVGLMMVVGQAILRRLPLDHCGCFGEIIHLPLRGVIVVDITILLLTLLCLNNLKQTAFLSIDRFYAKE